MPLFAHLFEEADLRVIDLEAATSFLPIKAEVRDPFELLPEIADLLLGFTGLEC